MTQLAEYASRLGFRSGRYCGLFSTVSINSHSIRFPSSGASKTSASEVMIANGAVRDALGRVDGHHEPDFGACRRIGRFSCAKTGQKVTKPSPHGSRNLRRGWSVSRTSLEAVEAKQCQYRRHCPSGEHPRHQCQKSRAARGGRQWPRLLVVVAEAINELSQKDRPAPQRASRKKHRKPSRPWVGRLREEASGVSNDASHVIESSV